MEIYALVGSSGTGKSHRAALLAHRLGAEIIIDDGLIINCHHIVTGLSAKTQPTRIGAIKTALFTDDKHAQNAKIAIEQLKPTKILILGTSNKMVEKIAARLELPAIKKYITIEQIASGKEIRKARTMRTQHSKHVIPAPTVEVRKSLPETIIDPLHVFLKRKDYQKQKNWLEKSIVRPTFTMYGKISISHSALEDIVYYAARTNHNITAIRRIYIIKDAQGLDINIDVVIKKSTQKLNHVGYQIQLAVKHQLEDMTGLNVRKINLAVVGLKTV